MPQPRQQVAELISVSGGRGCEIERDNGSGWGIWESAYHQLPDSSRDASHAPLHVPPPPPCLWTVNSLAPTRCPHSPTPPTCHTAPLLAPWGARRRLAAQEGVQVLVSVRCSQRSAEPVPRRVPWAATAALQAVWRRRRRSGCTLHHVAAAGVVTNALQPNSTDRGMQGGPKGTLHAQAAACVADANSCFGLTVRWEQLSG